MKKVTILLAALTIASATYAKEIMPVAEVAEEVPVTMSVAQSDMYLTVRFGGDFRTKYDKLVDGDITGKTNGFGGEVAVEGYKSLTNNFDMGLGLAYQFHADRDTSTGPDWSIDGAEYDSIPLYLTTKYNFNINSNIKPYLKANLGYSFNKNSSDAVQKDSSSVLKEGTSIDNGLYWALGGGVEYNNFTVDLMYSMTNARIAYRDFPGIKEDNDYERVVLSVGYMFNL